MTPPPPPTRSLLLAVLPAVLGGCALHATRSGLVQLDGDRVLLREPEGGELRLVLDEESDPVRFLESVEVEVEGPRCGRRLLVRAWEVRLTAGGSVPYLGRLRRFGNNWLLDDRVTGSTLVIEPASLGTLGDHEGHLVMVEGFVVGPHVLRGVSWRPLYDAGSEGEGPG